MTGLSTAVRPAADRPEVSQHRAPTPAHTASDSASWRRVVPFVALTFALTWLLDLALALTGGFAQPGWLVALQLQMMIPAASAILLGFLSARYGSERVRESTGRARAFFLVFLAITLVYVGMAAAGLIAPSLAPTLSLVSSLGISPLSVIVLLFLRLAGGRESFARAGLTFGGPKQWLLFGGGLVLLYSAESALNYVFGLGSVPDIAAVAAKSGMSVEALIAVGAGGVLVDLFLGLALFYFGEEYGWRDFLQGELIKLGNVRGVLAVGIIWGLWHAPLIAMGYNYPSYPILGILLMVAFTTVLGFVLGYAVLKTGSIWLAAFLHGLNNTFSPYLASTIYTPNDPAFQFLAGGIYGLVLLAVVVLLLLRDPIWKASGSNASHALGTTTQVEP